MSSSIRSKSPPGSVSCQCCPYGYHIDVDFVHYCEKLLAALYGCDSHGHAVGHKHLKSMLRTTSLPSKRRFNSFNNNLTSPLPVTSPDDSQKFIYNLYDYNKNSIGARGAGIGPNGTGAGAGAGTTETGFWPSRSGVGTGFGAPKSGSTVSLGAQGSVETNLLTDNLLGDAVARFEEAWLESKKQKQNSYNGNEKTDYASLMRENSNRNSSENEISRSESGNFKSENGNLRNGNFISDFRQNYYSEFESPPPSPAPSSTSQYTTSSTNISKAVLTQIRDQMAQSLLRMKELEDQVKDIPFMRQQVIVLKEEKKKLIKKLNGESDDDFNSINSNSRVKELEKSGFITPPMMRRKLLMKSDYSDGDSNDEFDEMFTRTSPPPSKLISSKNIRLEDVNQTETETTTKLSTATTESATETSLNMIDAATSTKLYQVDAITNTDNHNQNLTVLGSITIDPQAASNPQGSGGANSGSRITRSIGTTTNLAPSLPRKSIGISTDLKAHDTVSLIELQSTKPRLVSWGTDPIKIDSFDAYVEAKPQLATTSTRTDIIQRRNTGVSCNPIDLKPRTWNCHSQTEKIKTSNKVVQANESCPKCELRQTETVGVGDADIRDDILRAAVDKETETLDTSMISQISPGSRTSSSQSIRLCDKCNDAITNCARDVIGPPNASPTLKTRIPRPIHIGNIHNSTGSLERRQVHDKIIEESQNEILVYKNPIQTKSAGASPVRKSAGLSPIRLSGSSSPIRKSAGSPVRLSAGSSPVRLSAPPLPPPRRKEYNQRDIKAIDDIFKIISESEESVGSSSESSESDSDEEASYEIETGKVNKEKSERKTSNRQRTEPSQEIKAALKVLNDNLLKPEKSNKDVLTKSLSIIEKEWFKIAAEKDSDSKIVEDYLDCFETYSKHLLNRVVNLDDTSGNTAMHYAISHCNFDIVSVLLDSKVCDVNKQNKAGYTAIMLVALAKIENETQKAVIRRLFQLGDVNVKAKQNGQTALMLAASHGQFSTCKILLESGAAINVQDNDGSTSLMCAAEHGHGDVVRLLLSHPDCDPTITDNDGSTALKIAMQKGRNDIGLMLYASTSMLSRGSSPYASLRRTQSKAIAAQLRRTGSFSSYSQPMNNPSSRTFQLASSPPSRSRHSSVKSNKSSRN